MSDYLPREALLSILCRLPVQTLLRFRCVCRSWRSLISAPDFVAAHLRCTKPPQLLLRHFSLNPKRELYSLRSDHDDAFTSLIDRQCPFKTRTGYFFRIVGNCNGLICLSDDFFGYTYTIILWNPAIRRYLTLPKSNVCFDDYGPYMFSLGFGFDSKNNDYKIVRVVYLEGPDTTKGKGWSVPPKVEVYSLNRGSWKTLKSSHIKYNMLECLWSSCFLNGSVHWIAYTGGKSSGFCNVVLVFIMGSEVFRHVKLPERLVGESPLNLVVAAYKDMISVVCYENRGPCTSKGFEVWVMKEYAVEGSWSKHFSINLSGGVSMVVGFRNNGDVVVEEWDGNLVSCLPWRVKALGISGGKDSFYMESYKQSLVLLDGVNGVKPESSLRGGSSKRGGGGSSRRGGGGSSRRGGPSGGLYNPFGSYATNSLEKNSSLHYLFAAASLAQ